MAKALHVDIWSDIACPWCYIGKRRFEQALSRFEHGPAVVVTWRSFELDPSAPAQRDGSQTHAERLARKYGMPVEHAQQRIAHVVSMGAAEGLSFDFDHIRPGNTFTAHRLLHFARERGRQIELKERLLRAYLCEGVALGEPANLLSLAGQAGLDIDETQAVLGSDSYAEAVRGDINTARQLGVDGVPFFRVGRYGVSGAQGADLFLGALQQAWRELPEPVAGAAAEPNVCGPDGCV